MRQNAFVEGALMLDGRPVNLRSIRCPVLSILTRFDEVVPPAASRPIGDLVGSEEFELHEIDAGHIGLLIGRSAHKGTYPKIIEWLHEHRDRKED
jgi:polyhydroxyalkanoate synthase